jgi:protease-4
MTKRLKIFLGILIFLLVGFVVLYFTVLRFERITYFSGYGSNEYDSCSVAGVIFQGELYTYLASADRDYDYASSEEIYYYLSEAEDAESVKVVVLEIDSYGGSPVAAEELANKIKSMTKPVIVMIREAGLSAGYWVASAGDRVFASRLSEVGSIGVTMSYLDESAINEKSGYVWNDLSTGRFKDSGNRQKPLTDEERAIFERDLSIVHEEFVRVVAENRGLSVEKVRELADGSSMLGQMALEEGLIDEIGFIEEVKEYIKMKYGVEGEICW